MALPPKKTVAEMRAEMSSSSDDSYSDSDEMADDGVHGMAIDETHKLMSQAASARVPDEAVYKVLAKLSVNHDKQKLEKLGKFIGLNIRTKDNAEEIYQKICAAQRNDHIFAGLIDLDHTIQTYEGLDIESSKFKELSDNFRTERGLILADGGGAAKKRRPATGQSGGGASKKPKQQAKTQNDDDLMASLAKKKKRRQLALKKKYEQDWKKRPSHIRLLGWDESDTDEEELSEEQIRHELVMHSSVVAGDDVLYHNIDDLVLSGKYDVLKGIAKHLLVKLTKTETCRSIGEKLKQKHRSDRTVSRIQGVEAMVNATTGVTGRVLLRELTIFALKTLAQYQLGDTYYDTNNKDELIDQLMPTFEKEDDIHDVIHQLQYVSEGESIFETMTAAEHKEAERARFTEELGQLPNTTAPAEEATVFTFDREEGLLPRFSKTLRF